LNTKRWLGGCASLEMPPEHAHHGDATAQWPRRLHQQVERGIDTPRLADVLQQQGVCAFADDAARIIDANVGKAGRLGHTVVTLAAHRAAG
jgi:hypothetical protein